MRRGKPNNLSILDFAGRESCSTAFSVRIEGDNIAAFGLFVAGYAAGWMCPLVSAAVVRATRHGMVTSTYRRTGH